MALDVAGQTQPRLRYDDEDFLAMVRAERQNAIGMDSGDNTLQSDRERALDYYKGDMSEIPVMANRSRAVHTVVSDTIEQALPDLVEIFLGGETIGAFKPIGEEDEEAAKQETEVVSNVIANENDGFGLMHDYVHDALLMKTGVFHAYILRDEAYEEEVLQNQTAMAVQMLQQQEQAGESEVLQVAQTGEDRMVGPLFSVTVSRKRTNVCVHIDSVAPEDFAVGRDTVALRDATYAVVRQFPRAQKLKEMGFDSDKVDEMPAWGGAADQTLDRARDTAGENDEPISAGEAVSDLRQVMIYIHVLRVDADGDGKPEIWRIVTDENETVLLDKERLYAVPFAAGTPYRQPHRFYGRSMADLTMELQRIMTALLRLHLDGGFFALNARHEINVKLANEHTLSDYLNNTPGMPVRSNGEALKPLISSKSDFDALASLEYMATVKEERTGVTRNAQGLNPDTLHDTAKGAEALMTNAQKRLRMIARCLAETGVKDLYLLVHSLLRTSGMDRPLAMRLKGQWTPVDPTSWGERKDFTVEIGMGAGGREMDLQAGIALGNVLDKLVEGQATGAISPAIVTSKNLFSYADWYRERLGIKKTTFFTDPDSAEGQQLAQSAQQNAQKPDPKVIEAQSKAQLAKQAQDHAEAMAQAESQRKDAVAKADLDRKSAEATLADRLANEKAAEEARLAQQKADEEVRLAQEKQNSEYQLALRQQDLDFELAERKIEKDREVGHANAAAKVEIAGMNGEDTDLPKNRPGGALDE